MNVLVQSATALPIVLLQLVLSLGGYSLVTRRADFGPHSTNRAIPCGDLHKTRLQFQRIVQGIEDVYIASGTEYIQPELTSISTRPAHFDDLVSVVNLRVAAFYPTAQCDWQFQHDLLMKVRSRFQKGTVCLVAESLSADKNRLSRNTTRSDSFSDNGASYPSSTNLIATVRALQKCELYAQSHGLVRVDQRKGTPATESIRATTYKLSLKGSGPASSMNSGEDPGDDEKISNKPACNIHTSKALPMEPKRPVNLPLVCTQSATEESAAFIKNGLEDQGHDLNAILGNVVGTAEFNPFDFQGTAMTRWGARRKLYLADLCVRSDARRRGIGSQLLREAERYAAQRGYSEIYLHVDAHNEIAKRLYSQCGYHQHLYCEATKSFTESRLQQSAHAYVMFYKAV